MKKIMVTVPYMPPKDEYHKYLDKIWKNKWLTNKGPLILDFEQELLHKLNGAFLCLTVNGHSALDIAIKGLGLTGEIITTPFTFASTVHAIEQNHIKPVFCDIKESDLTMDEEKIEALITDKTSAILPVHVYGHACNVKKIEAIAKKHNLKVIYDAAHAFGVQKDGVSIATEGDASIFSFHATKIFHTIEGGAILYSDDFYTRLFQAYRNFGIEGEEQVDFVGGNAKMNEFQAAMGLVNLKHFDEMLSKRKQLTLYYREKLSSIRGIHYFVPESLSDYTYNYAYFPVLIDEEILHINRDELYEKLKEYEIYSRKYFYPLVPDFGCYKDRYQKVALPVARRVARQILCLPLYYDLSYQDIDYICESILNILKDVED